MHSQFTAPLNTRRTRCTVFTALTIHCTAEHSLHRIHCTSNYTYSLTHIHSAPYSLHHASLTASLTAPRITHPPLPSMLLCWHSTQSDAQVVTMANRGADLSDIRKVIVATNNRSIFSKAHATHAAALVLHYSCCHMLPHLLHSLHKHGRHTPELTARAAASAAQKQSVGVSACLIHVVSES